MTFLQHISYTYIRVFGFFQLKLVFVYMVTSTNSPVNWMWRNSLFPQFFYSMRVNLSIYFLCFLHALLDGAFLFGVYIVSIGSVAAWINLLKNWALSSVPEARHKEHGWSNFWRPPSYPFSRICWNILFYSITLCIKYVLTPVDEHELHYEFVLTLWTINLCFAL